MSINIKKKSKLYKVLDAPSLLDLLVFGFLIDEHHNLLLLNKTIHAIIMGKIQKFIDKIVNKFNKAYSEYLMLDKNLLKKQFRRYYSSKNELKIDFPLYFSPKSYIKDETIYSLSYGYEIWKKRKLKKYLWKTQFLLSNKKSRTLWLYKEEQLDSQNPPLYTTDTLPLQYDDKLCLLIPYFNFSHLIEPQQIIFFELEKQTNSEIQCQVENMHEWIHYDYYSNAIDFEVQDIIRSYPRNMKCESIKKSSINSNFRIEFKMLSSFKGKIFNYAMECEEEGKSLKIDLKKKGYYDEKSKKISLRVGDHLIVYLMKK